MSFRFVLLFLGSLLALVVGCGRKVGSIGHEPDAQVDAGPVLDAALWHDGGATALPTDCVQFDFCEDGFFKLPLDRTLHETYSRDSHGNQVVYSKALRPSHEDDLYLFDLQACVECRLTNGRVLGSAAIHGSQLAYVSFTDDRTYMRLHIVDLESWTETLLLDTLTYKDRVALHGSNLVYSQFEGTYIDRLTPPELVLHHLDTGESTTLAGDGCFVQSPEFDIGDRYVVWHAKELSGSDGDPPYIFAYDLESGSMRRLEPPGFYWPANPQVWNHQVTWLTKIEEAPSWDGLNLTFFDLETSMATNIVELDTAFPLGFPDWSLIANRTSRYSNDPGPYIPADVEVYDTKTGATARITTESTHHFSIIDFSFPWLTLVRWGPSEYGDLELYVAHLERLGVVDADDRVIPSIVGVVVPPPE